MSTTKIFAPAPPWHESHKLKGAVFYHRLGPGGSEHCTLCGARRWVEKQGAPLAADCGGSVEYDSRAAKPCKPITKGQP
jgi:hypothetical protein